MAVWAGGRHRGRAGPYLEHRRLLFATAYRNAVLELLAPDVTAWSDGGGKVTAARRPLYGTDHVARWILGFLGKPELPG